MNILNICDWKIKWTTPCNGDFGNNSNRDFDGWDNDDTDNGKNNYKDDNGNNNYKDDTDDDDSSNYNNNKEENDENDDNGCNDNNGNYYAKSKINLNWSAIE